MSILTPRRRHRFFLYIFRKSRNHGGVDHKSREEPECFFSRIGFWLPQKVGRHIKNLEIFFICHKSQFFHRFRSKWMEGIMVYLIGSVKFERAGASILSCAFCIVILYSRLHWALVFFRKVVVLSGLDNFLYTCANLFSQFKITNKFYSSKWWYDWSIWNCYKWTSGLYFWTG